MLNLNKVTLIGNLVKQPEISEAGGQQRTLFTVATNRSWISNGERRTDAQFHSCVAWGTLATHIAKFEKGRAVYIEGHLNHRFWKDPDTEKNTRYTEVVVDHFGPVGHSRSDETSESSPTTNSEEETPKIKESESTESTDLEINL